MTILSAHLLATLITLTAPAAAQDSDVQVKGPPKVGDGSTGEDMQVPGKPGDTTTRGNLPGVGYDNRGGMMDSASLEAQALNGGGIHYHNHYYGGGADGYGTANYVIPPQNTGTFRGNYGMARGGYGGGSGGGYGGGYRGGVNYYGGAGAYGRTYQMNTNAQFRAADARNGVFNPYARGGSGRTYWSD
jgi:hypothetical protein